MPARRLRWLPTVPLVHGLLGGLLCSTGQYGEALAHLEAAHAANPGDVTVANNLAWLLATCPDAAYRDGPRALRLAEWACKATSYKSPPLLDSLAAAYAETGPIRPGRAGHPAGHRDRPEPTRRPPRKRSNPA